MHSNARETPFGALGSCPCLSVQGLYVEGNHGDLRVAFELVLQEIQHDARRNPGRTSVPDLK